LALIYIAHSLVHVVTLSGRSDIRTVMNGIYLAEYRNKWQACVNIVMNSWSL